MSFWKTRIFKNDETSVTWGKLAMILGIIAVGGTALVFTVFQIFKSFN